MSWAWRRIGDLYQQVISKRDRQGSSWLRMAPS